jgi:DNA-binding transcriptional regulator LsrR (DeoR family)
MSNRKQLSWRRNKVFEYLVKGLSQNEIAEILHVSESTISCDISYLRKESREQIQTHLQERIPMEYNQCLSGVDEILKYAWVIASSTNKSDEKTRLQALSLANECYRHKMDLITNGVVIDDSLKFVSANKDKVKITKNEIDHIITAEETVEKTIF